MFASKRFVLSVVAAAALGGISAGCEGSLGFTGVKETFLGKPTPTPDLPDRPKLVIPQSANSLPVPGEAAPARPQWATGTQEPNKQAQAQEAPAKQESSGWFSGLFR
jgi:hypothetical protein